MTMRATRLLAITVIGATVLGRCGSDHRMVSVNGDHRG
jgi:hypothetical protein